MMRFSTDPNISYKVEVNKIHSRLTVGIKGNNKYYYRPASRYMRLLKSYNAEPVITKVVTQACRLCKCPMKKVIKPPKKPDFSRMVEDAWVETDSDRRSWDHPKIHVIFRDWSSEMMGMKRQVVNLPLEEYENKTTRAHHLNHHKYLIEKNKPKIIEKSLVCASCPDPNRPWIRDRGRPHLIEPMLLDHPEPISRFLSERYSTIKRGSLDNLIKVTKVIHFKDENRASLKKDLLQILHDSFQKDSI